MKTKMACKDVREASGSQNSSSRSIFKEDNTKVRGIIIVKLKPRRGAPINLDSNPRLLRELFLHVQPSLLRRIQYSVKLKVRHRHNLGALLGQ